MLLGQEMQVNDAADRIRAVLSDGSGLVTVLTHGRCALTVSGEGARAAIASACPLELSDRAFGADQCARSVFAETGLFIEQLDDRPTFRLLVDQSAAEAVWARLSEALEWTQAAGATPSCP